MRLDSFVIKANQLFTISYTGHEGELYDNNIEQYVIPMYQREYTWTIDRVCTLIDDINNKNKFLGNVILDRKDKWYEIVDGQQRITTLFLILVALYNSYAKEGEEEANYEQKYILEYIIKNRNIVLKNDTVGEYLYFNKNQIELKIEDKNDIYYQSNTFRYIYNQITNKLSEIKNRKELLNKLLDCEFCLLICGDLGQTESVERIFLDMNFKLQKLDVEAIFKGYCFQNCRAVYHGELKNQWIKLKTNSRIFFEWGYKDFSQFLYHYFLSKPESYNITEDLSPKGIHCLDGMDSDQTKKIIDDIVLYSTSLNEFGKNLRLSDYKFFDICPDAKRYNTNDYIILKNMCSDILEIKTVQYHKLPFMMFIYYIKEKKLLVNNLNYNDFKKFITNYYIYSCLFIVGKGRKKKDSIDHTLFEVIYKSTTVCFSSIIEKVKILRNTLIKDFFISEKMDSIKQFYALYSILDYYDNRKCFVTNIYSLLNGYNKEHLIINDNKRCEVQWVEGDKYYVFDLKGIEQVNNLKKLTCNYLIIDKELNRTLGHKDIVEKISIIEDYFKNNIPLHIKLILEHIKSLSAYIEISKLKYETKDEKTIKLLYYHFIYEYFSEKSRIELYEKLTKSFQYIFK